MHRPVPFIIFCITFDSQTSHKVFCFQFFNNWSDIRVILLSLLVHSSVTDIEIILLCKHRYFYLYLYVCCFICAKRFKTAHLHVFKMFLTFITFIFSFTCTFFTPLKQLSFVVIVHVHCCKYT